MRQQYRGAYRDAMVVQPIDPSRPHRAVETEVGRAGTCAICACRTSNSIHSDEAKQRTVEFRNG